jgi:hypothetical protein
MTERLYIMTPQELLDNNLSSEQIGDIRHTSLDEARAKLGIIARDKGLGRAGIALLASRQEDIPGTLALPAHGLIYPIFPSPEAEAEWQAFREDFTHVVRAPGQLHAYDRDIADIAI